MRKKKISQEKRENMLEKKRIKLEEKKNKKRIRQIKKLEKNFSANKYDGRGKKQIRIVDGNSVLAISTSYSVNSYIGEGRKADQYIGAITRMVANDVGCHAMCIERSYYEIDKLSLLREIQEFIEKKQLKVLIDLFVVETTSDSVIFLEKDNVDERDSFIKLAIGYSFEYKYRDITNVKIVEEIPNNDRGINIQAARSKNISAVSLGINKKYLDVAEKEVIAKLYDALYDTMTMLANIDWNASQIMVYRLWQSGIQKPQDKIEIETIRFAENSLLDICSYNHTLEQVRMHKIRPDFEKRFRKNQKNMEEYIFLTNRLIGLLAGENWNPQKHGGMPVVVYENTQDEYPVGLPMANQIDGVFFSSKLFEAKQNEAKMFDYMIFNRYTDSRFNIEFENADYKDYKDGEYRVKEKKVMIPRYYKRLLGYLDYPLKVIRAEEYVNIGKKLREQERQSFEACYERIVGEVFWALRKNYISRDDNELDVTEFVEELVNPEKKRSGTIKKIIHKKISEVLGCDDKYPILFERYSIEDEFDVKRIEKDDNSYYVLVIKEDLKTKILEKVPDIESRLKESEVNVDELINEYAKMDDDLEEEIKHIRINKVYASFALGRLGVYDKVEILRVPKNVKRKMSIWKRIANSIDKIIVNVLKLSIGKADYLLKTEWCSETDDRNNIARLGTNMMSLLGVSENDKIVVKFGKRQEVLRVLIDDELTDYQIGIPAPARKRLGMNSINDIVVVHRDMKHIFLRHSEEQTIAILGTVLAVYQVITISWIAIVACAITIPIIMYFVLNTERIKVK